MAIVKEAEANNASVRAVGSAWSFTDVWATPHYLVLTEQLNSPLSVTMTGETFPGDLVFGAVISRMLKYVINFRLQSRILQCVYKSASAPLPQTGMGN